MFGISSNQMDVLVKRHKWDKINQKLDKANAKAKLELATACADSKDEGSLNCLIILLKDDDKSVQLQAVKSLGSVGTEFAKTHLQLLDSQIPEGKSELRDAIHDTIAKINSRK